MVITTFCQPIRNDYTIYRQTNFSIIPAGELRILAVAGVIALRSYGWQNVISTTQKAALHIRINSKIVPAVRAQLWREYCISRLLFQKIQWGICIQHCIQNLKELWAGNKCCFRFRNDCLVSFIYLFQIYNYTSKRAFPATLIILIQHSGSSAYYGPAG